MSYKTKGLILAVIFLVAIIWVVFSSSYEKSIYLPEIGDEMPDFTLNDLEGKPYSFANLLEGKRGILINFMATWCPPCIEELPELLKFAEKLEKNNIRVVFIVGESPLEEIKKLKEKFDIKYKIIIDEAGKTGEKYGITGYPETFIGNSKGILVKKFIGPQKWGDQEIFDSIKSSLSLR